MSEPTTIPMIAGHLLPCQPKPSAGNDLMIGHILAISLFHAFIPAAERLGGGLHIVDNVAGK